MADGGSSARPSTRCAPGGWRDLVTLLHPPYTAWHLSYVALGAVAAPQLHADRLLGGARRLLPRGRRGGARARRAARPAAADAAVRPRARRARRGRRWPARSRSASRAWSSSRRRLAPFVVAGAFLVLAYNLELFGGRFHTDFWFAAAWGAFPALTGYWVNALGSSVAARRRRSSPSRLLRAERRAAAALHAGARAAPAHRLGDGEQRLTDGTRRRAVASAGRAARRRPQGHVLGASRARSRTGRGETLS